MPKERRLPIGFLSAHVTAATVHVLSRVSPITLAFSFINNSSLSYIQSHCLRLITSPPFFLVFLFSVCFPRLISSSLFTSDCFCFVPLLHVFFHCFPTLIFCSCHSLLCSTTICLHLPPTYLPDSLCLLPTFSPSHLTLNFEPRSLYLSPSIIVSPGQYTPVSLSLC